MGQAETTRKPGATGGLAAAGGTATWGPVAAACDSALKSLSRDPELVKRCFGLVVDEIHTTIVATTDDAGGSVTCVVDMMDYDEHGLYFLTNVGKAFHRRLVKDGRLSLSATDGRPTMECTAVTVTGKVREASGERLAAMLARNPYMYELYPTVEARATLRAFQIYDGEGNIYEMSEKPPRQTYFEF